LSWKKELSAQDPLQNPDYNPEKKNQNSERKSRVVVDPKAVN
jgi:hypothetical protein